MSRPRQQPRIYKNQELMDKLNDLFIRIKLELYHTEHNLCYNKPTVKEIDVIMNQIFNELKKDYTIIKKF